MLKSNFSHAQKVWFWGPKSWKKLLLGEAQVNKSCSRGRQQVLKKVEKKLGES